MIWLRNLKCPRRADFLNKNVSAFSELIRRAQKCVQFIRDYLVMEDGRLIRAAYTNEDGSVDKS